jgi:hypothetical protein
MHELILVPDDCGAGSANILYALTVYFSCHISPCVKIARSNDALFKPIALYLDRSQVKKARGGTGSPLPTYLMSANQIGVATTCRIE